MRLVEPIFAVLCRPLPGPLGMLRLGLSALLGCAIPWTCRGAEPLAWKSIAGGRSAPLVVAPSARAGFASVDASASGIRFTNVLSRECALTNQIELNGSGVALGDIDQDGLCDVFFCGLDPQNALFRNLGGWQFQDVTETSGLSGPGLRATGAAFADLDGDGDLDLVMNTVGQGTHFYVNDGRGRFAPSSKSPANPGRAGMSLALADADSDGDLDLYVANYRTETIRDRPDIRLQGEKVNGRLVVSRVDGRPATEPDLIGRFELTESGRVIEHGEPDVLFLNDGLGGFTPVDFTGGTFLDSQGAPFRAPLYDWGLSVAFRDFNGDGLPDLYVCNDFESPDRIWFNVGQGRFRAAPPTALRHTSIFSMGVDVGDINRDGHDDLFISDMLMQGHASRQLRIGDVPLTPHLPGSAEERLQYSFNTIQLSRGDGTFAETAWIAGAEASGWTWCPVLLDVDLDGWEDVLFTTGHEFDMMNGDVIERAEVLKGQRRMTGREQQALRTLFSRFNTPKVAFRNRGGLGFDDASATWGFADAAVSQGIALADLDQDGDLDVVVNNLNEPAAVYRNLSDAPRVAVRLRGLAPNTSGVGARITLRGGAVPEQSQEIVTGAHYLSSDEMLRVFAAGKSPSAMQLEVRWRSGKRSVIAEILANHIYEVSEADAAAGPAAKPPAPSPWFERVEGFAPRHTEPAFDDAERQPLLPFRLSQLGPGVAWLDYDDDGWEDLVIGAGKGGQPTIFHNNGKGGLEPSDVTARSRPVGRDQAGVVGTGSLFMMGASNYEDGATNGGWVRIYDTSRGAAGDSLMGPTSSTGPLALADVDHDGDLDLFVGGRARGGRYPEPAESILFRNDDGKLSPAKVWEKLGLVSGAVFSDLNADGRADLVLACEWGPVRVFWNDGNFQFREATQDLGLASWTGWWHGVTTGDFDGDGQLDLAVSNWGLNSRHRASAERPLRCYYGDLDGDGTLEVIEAQQPDGGGPEVPLRGFRAIGSALPWFREQVGTFEAFGKGTVKSLFGERLNACSVLEVRTLASMIFLNRGARFEPRELPAEAQWSAAFGVNVGDLDGDGREDLFVSQNFFAVPPDGARLDAGRGLWLKGDGEGGFRPVPGQESGVVIYGEQRGSALADYDGDGRVDLVVAENNGPASLYRNLRAQPGLRVRLEGTPGNRSVLGASMRLKSGGRSGPRREIHGGSGYWSQDGAVQVMYAPSKPDEVEIRWPDGHQTVSPVPAEARAIVVDATGQVKMPPRP